MSKKNGGYVQRSLAERFGFDANGNMTYKVSGIDSTAFTYDSRKRETYRWYSNSGHTVETKYTADSKKDTVIDHRGLTTYQWGICCGQLVRVDNPNGSFMEYEYDENKNITARITPWSRTEYSFDALNQNDSVYVDEGSITTYFYDAIGRRDSTSNSNGTSVGYEFDNLNRLTRVTNYNSSGVISDFTYTVNNAGVKTSVTEADGNRVDYGYDC